MMTSEELKEGDMIYVNLKLKPDLELVDQPSKVVRNAGTKTIDNEIKRLYGVEFLEVDMNLEKKLVRFVMEKELEYKKKGLLI